MTDLNKSGVQGASLKEENRDKETFVNKAKKVEPEMRFAGFTGNWVARKLGEIYPKILSGNRLPLSDIKKGDIPYIVAKTTDNGVQALISKDQKDFSGNPMKLFPSKSITFSIDNPDAIFIQKTMFTTSNVMRVLSKPSLTYNQNTFIAMLLKNSTKGFDWGSKFTGPVVSNLRKMMPATSSGQIDWGEIEKLGSFFHSLDKLIQSYENKVRDLTLLKKAYLQKMFPQDGMNVPEIRFGGFKDVWEKRKLGDVSSIGTGSSNAQDSVVNGKFPFFIRSDEIKRSNKYLFDGEAILIPGEGRLGDIYHYINGKFDYHQRVYKISNFKMVSGLFILFTLQNSFKQYAMKYTVKAAVDSLRLPTIQNFTLNVPNIDEQIKIGNFFQSFDNLITINQRKLNNLKKLKQTYLHQMFI